MVAAEALWVDIRYICILIAPLCPDAFLYYPLGRGTSMQCHVPPVCHSWLLNVNRVTLQ